MLRASSKVLPEVKKSKTVSVWSPLVTIRWFLYFLTGEYIIREGSLTFETSGMVPRFSLNIRFLSFPPPHYKVGRNGMSSVGGFANNYSPAGVGVA